MGLETEKADLRRSVAQRRKAAQDAGAGRTACRHLVADILTGPVKIVSGYLPIRSEIDPRPAMTALSALGLRLCVPVIEAAAQPLRFREWTPGVTLMPGPFGAEVPASGDWLVPDTLIVPLLAFDAALWRLGYGGGFYDRTLEGLRAGPGARAIGLAYAAQEVATVPREATDQPLDAVVTEAGVLRRSPAR